MRRLLTILTFPLILAGCSATIVPQATSPDATINPNDRSITINRGGVAMSARVQDTAVGGFSMSDTLTSFYVAVENRSGKPVSMSLESMSVHDNLQNTFAAVPPTEVNTMLQPTPNFLVPVPFVAFTDVVDREVYRASTAMASEAPYVGQPLDINTVVDPLTDKPIADGTRAAGMVFFRIDLLSVESAILRIKPPEGLAGVKSDFEFKFTVER